ncbi:MAG: OmpA family protein, partial [Acidobacteriia bacterium]|nr:OmpA family protein [Terriglobia bacterium]
ADEKAKAAQAAEQAALEKQRRAQAESERQAAEQAKREAEAAAAQAAKERADADAARAAAIEQQKLLAAQTQQARLSAEEAERARQLAEQQRLQAEQQRQQAENEKTALRERLKQQLNMILETQETARGLIVNISDVLFDFNKYTLKADAREKMAKVSGILLAYPGLKIQLEGHTDNIGSDDYNMKLSQQRADAVRDYLTAQGVSSNSVSAVGLGKAGAVASNDTAAGRQKNRRVDMVVSGEPIGIELTPAPQQ